MRASRSSLPSLELAVALRQLARHAPRVLGVRQVVHDALGRVARQARYALERAHRLLLAQHFAQPNLERHICQIILNYAFNQVN